MAWAFPLNDSSPPYLCLQVAGQIFIAQLTAYELVHVAADISAGRHAGLESDVG